MIYDLRLPSTRLRDRFDGILAGLHRSIGDILVELCFLLCRAGMELGCDQTEQKQNGDDRQGVLSRPTEQALAKRECDFFFHGFTSLRSCRLVWMVGWQIAFERELPR